VLPSICSRRMSAWPACRAVSSIMCTRTQRIDGGGVSHSERAPGPHEALLTELRVKDALDMDAAAIDGSHVRH
jgi:hypothetical protein